MHLSQITPSLFASLGLADASDQINCGASPNGRELLFLVDGLGADAVEKFSSYIPTLSSLIRHGAVRTSFPSTTATSLATLTTGVNPGTHGMLGYTVQVPRSGGRILNSLKWDERVDPAIWQPVPTLFERATAADISVTHVAAKRYEDTGFTRAVFRGAKYRGANIHEDLVTETVEALKKTPSFVYLYVNELDVAGHSDGVGSEKWLIALSVVAELITGLRDRLPKGTRLWVTADHGMINVGEKIILGQDNNLMKNVTLVGGEPRARHMYVTAGAINETVAIWRETLGNKVEVFSRDEAIAAKLFGAVTSLDSSERMGDFIAIAKAEAIFIDPGRIKEESKMVGHHGGMGTAEVDIPLLTFQN